MSPAGFPHLPSWLQIEQVLRLRWLLRPLSWLWILLLTWAQL
jgi:hypothetical protein